MQKTEEVLARRAARLAACSGRGLSVSAPGFEMGQEGRLPAQGGRSKKYCAQSRRVRGAGGWGWGGGAGGGGGWVGGGTFARTARFCRKRTRLLIEGIVIGPFVGRRGIQQGLRLQSAGRVTAYQAERARRRAAEPERRRAHGRAKVSAPSTSSRLRRAPAGARPPTFCGEGRRGTHGSAGGQAGQKTRALKSRPCPAQTRASTRARRAHQQRSRRLQHRSRSSWTWAAPTTPKLGTDSSAGPTKRWFYWSPGRVQRPGQLPRFELGIPSREAHLRAWRAARGGAGIKVLGSPAARARGAHRAGELGPAPRLDPGWPRRGLDARGFGAPIIRRRRNSQRAGS